MRRSGAGVVIALLGVVVAAGAATVLGGPTESASASCVDSLSWRGTGYGGAAPKQPKVLKIGARLETKALIPPCIDTVPAPDPLPKAAKVVVRRYVGVPPQLALSTRDGGVWVAEGYFPAMPSHPLHRAFYGRRPGVPDATRGIRCSRSRTVRAVVGNAFFGLEVDPRGERRRLDVAVDALTSIVGFDRFGTPHLKRGDRIAVSGVSCRDPDLYPPGFFVARLVRPSRQR